MMKKHPCFVATGRPLVESDFDRLLVDFWLPENHVLCSGDFSQATDNLDPSLSQFTAGEISKMLELLEEPRLLFSEGLTGATFPSGSIQSWGQLMGSPISFPVLNFVNAAIFHACYENYEFWRYVSLGYSVEDAIDFSRTTLAELPVMTNGDDIGFRAERSFHAQWCKWTLACGLPPSVGKNFVSDKWITMNSTFYELQNTVLGLEFRVVPYVNLGLIHRDPRDVRNFERWMDADSFLPSTLRFIGPMSRELTRSWRLDDAKCVLLMQLFMTRWHDTLKKCAPGVSYFLSEPMGGLGIYCPYLWRSSPGLVSKAQWLIATEAILEEEPCELFRVGDDQIALEMTREEPTYDIVFDSGISVAPCDSGSVLDAIIRGRCRSTRVLHANTHGAWRKRFLGRLNRAHALAKETKQTYCAWHSLFNDFPFRIVKCGPKSTYDTVSLGQLRPLPPLDLDGDVDEKVDTPGGIAYEQASLVFRDQALIRSRIMTSGVERYLCSAASEVALCLNLSRICILGREYVTR
jgi:hypothetical protein